MDNAKHYSRLVKKSPTMNMIKNDMISYMIKHHVEIPLPLHCYKKPVLFQKICEANIPKKYVVDEMALDAGYSALKLPPYHCVMFDIILHNNDSSVF